MIVPSEGSSFDVFFLVDLGGSAINPASSVNRDGGFFGLSLLLIPCGRSVESDPVCRSGKRILRFL